LRVIFLNSWFGKAEKPFFDFVKKESSKTDIFCFMEVSPALYSNLSSILKKFNGLYQKGHYIKTFGVSCGQAIFLAKRVKNGKTGKVLIYRQSIRDLGFMQFAELVIGKKKLWLGSVHGKTLPGDKLDTPTRIKQSEIIINFFAGKRGLKMIGGDFNLMPDTKSIEMFEKAGYRNLISDFKIKSTRNHFSWEQAERQYKENGDPFFERQDFADYVFVSPGVKVKSFEVPNIIEEKANEIAVKAIELAKHAGRKTIKGDDIRLAAKELV